MCRNKFAHEIEVEIGLDPGLYFFQCCRFGNGHAFGTLHHFGGAFSTHFRLFFFPAQEIVQF